MRPDVVLTTESANPLWTVLGGGLLRTPVLIFHEHRGRGKSGIGAPELAYRRLLLRLAHGETPKASSMSLRAAEGACALTNRLPTGLEPEAKGFASRLVVVEGERDALDAVLRGGA
jgi:hypothetical protein